MIDRIVDRALNRTIVPGPYPASRRAAALCARAPVVDLLVGTPLFRRTILEPVPRGHVDLPRLRAGGVRIVGLSLATRFPDLEGTLSAPQLASLGVPARALPSDPAILAFLARRVEAWAAASGGDLVVVRSVADLEAALAPGGPVGAFLGVQGAHVLRGRIGRIAGLQAMGVRMLALVHVMDGAAAGSSTGRRGGGLTPWGGRVIAELERNAILVDLAHASSAAIRDAVPRLTRPFVVSHTGFLERSSAPSRWRRYSAATRNVRMQDARFVAAAGGVVGVAFAAQLVGGRTVGDLADSIRFAVDELGPAAVAIGSDLDGALPAVVDAAGFPVVADALLAAGMTEETIAAILGGNALRVLRAVLPR